MDAFTPDQTRSLPPIPSLLNLLCTLSNSPPSPLFYPSPSLPPFLSQTWIGPVLLCINPFEAPGPAMHTVLKQLAERVLQDISGDKQPRVILFRYDTVCINVLRDKHKEGEGLNEQLRGFLVRGMFWEAVSGPGQGR